MEDRYTRTKLNEVRCNHCGMEMIDLLASVHVCKNEQNKETDYEIVVKKAIQSMLEEIQPKPKPKKNNSKVLVIETPPRIEACEESKPEEIKLSSSSSLSQTQHSRPKAVKSIRTTNLFREVKIRERKIARLLRNIGKNHEAITYKSFRKIRLLYES